MNKGRIIILGGGGHLGQAIADYVDNKTAYTCISFTHSSYDITRHLRSLVKFAGPEIDNNPDDILTVVINCAAITSPRSERRDPNTWAVNAVAPGVLSRLSADTHGHGFRFVHISTDSVFSGVLGNYRETDPPTPINYYGTSKAAGEVGVLAANPNALVIRAAFRYDGRWPYERAFTDAYRSHKWMSEIVPEIVSAAMIPRLSGILHIGGVKQSVFNMARGVSPNVEPCLVTDFKDFAVPRDISLDSSKWERIKAENGLL